MQNIHVDKILEAVKLLHDRYQFESPHALNRWLVMTLVKAAFVPDKLSAEELIASMPSNYALTLKPADFSPDIAKDISSAAELLGEQMSEFFSRFNKIMDRDVNAECWVSYHEINPSTYAMSIRDGSVDERDLLSISVFNHADWPAADSIHVRDGQIIPEEVQ